MFVLALVCLGNPMVAQPGQALGRSVTWQQVQAPFTPNSGSGAIVGGPGNDPNPGTPMYLCRASIQGSVTPGKWVQGSCNVPFGGSENIMGTYEIGYGYAQWAPYRGNTYGLVQTGNESDGRPLFSCRVRYFAGVMRSDYGYQPGKIVSDGTCHIPMGGSEVTQNPPFEALYGTGGGRPPNPYPYPPPYPYPYPNPQPPPALPPCRMQDPGVAINADGLWAGPNCTPADMNGNVPGAPPAPAPYRPPPPPYQPGPSSVSWQPVQTPFQPGQGAIPGGPGNGPKPDAPLYICRGAFNSGLYPGRWVEGKCIIDDGTGKEQALSSYEVANGNARWQNFDGNIGALVPGGYDIDGTPLYICRVRIKQFGDKGLQPGRLTDGKCKLTYAAIEHVVSPPFDALYNVFGVGGPDQQ